MVHSACPPARRPKEYTLDELGAFHAHTGPYVVLGYRIGKFVRDTFCDDPFALSARVYCPSRSPERCMVDGIQCASGCTLGKGNIAVIDDADVRVEFFAHDRKIVIRPLPFTRPVRNTTYAREMDRLARQMYAAAESDLFVAAIG
ncbi:MAG: formylmethanofuran dehydrogenase [Methanomicrobiales archaeon]|nr:formylmethanofuran dehydrogenase [Methanomicrobiales archaeon]